MVQTVQKQLPNQHQLAAQELLQISDNLNNIYLDQLHYLKDISSDNFFQFDLQAHKLNCVNGLFTLYWDEDKGLNYQIKHNNTHLKINRLIQYFTEEIDFYTQPYYEIHPTDLKTKTQIIRQTLIEQVFEWVDGENRVEQYLYNISLSDAQLLDQILIKYEYFDHAYVSDFAKYGKAIPLSVEINIKHLVLINSVLGQSFLPVNDLVQKIHQLCFSLNKFIPEHYLKIFKVFYPESLRLQDVVQHFESYKLLSQHAQEQPQMIAFSKMLKRGFWQYHDLFNKQHFLNAKDEYWELDQIGSLPIFTLKRTANWLYKQDAMVNDWIAIYLNDTNVRITITALSFIDTSKISPEVLLCVLKYFKNIASRLFLIECHCYAITNEWQDDLKNTKYTLVKLDSDSKSNRKFISKTNLDIEHWLDFSRLMLVDDPQNYKRLFTQINRVVQAFMLFVQAIANELPHALVKFIDPEMQQLPEFYRQLKQHDIKVEDFRKRFKHINTDRTPCYSIFDSFVLDYVLDLFHQQHDIERNVTWTGLYQQAKRWHENNYFQDTMSKLKQSVEKETWDRVSPMQKIYLNGWCYEELNSLKRIIQESTVFKHCLALSYSARIVEREYVAFHMSNIDDPRQEMTLGCYYKLGRLIFDQLRLPSNHIPDESYMAKAQTFIDDVNQHLKWKSSIQPNEELGNL